MCEDTKGVNASISVPITIFENRLPLPLWRPRQSYWPRPMMQWRHISTAAEREL